jgi:zinc-ribbon domain
MPAFLRRALERYAQKVNRSAVGTAVPAGTEPGGPRGPTARERTLMRRRLRSLRRRREALMREVGGLVLESRHEENGSAERLDSRTHELEEVDAEARAIVEALRELKTMDELLSSGVSARCSSCGELVAARERFCPNCGAQVSRAGAPGSHPPAGRQTHAAAPAAVVTGASSARSPSPPSR